MELGNRLNKFLVIISSLTLLSSCVEMHDTFQTKRLVSSKGEKIYINTLNWGMTDDYQYTIISKDSNRLKERKDTIGGISGLTPFIYRLKDDTLTVFLQDGNKMDIKEEFETIELNYVFLNNKDYIKLMSEAGIRNSEYHLASD